MSSKFVYHRHGNPCPVCGGTKTQCRTTTTDDGRRKTHCRGKVDAPAGWGYVGDDKYGFPQFIEGWNDRQERDWDAIARAKAEREARETQRLHRAALTSVRDEAYRAWQPYQRLSQVHRQQLRDRGLMDAQIDAAEGLGWLRTWTNGVRFNTKKGIPGQTWDGTLRSAMGADGLAIAAPNWRGLLAGFQVRPDDAVIREETAKYLSLPGQHLKNGEQPMPVYGNPDGHTGPVTIAITEGHLKAMVTGFRHWSDRPDLVMVGSNGSNWSGAPAQWKKLIEHFTPQGIAAIELLPDAGARSNPAIVESVNALAALLKSLGHTLKVRWWGQWEKEGKGAMDPDEAPPEMIWAGDRLTVEQFAVDGAIVHWSQAPQRMAVPRPGTVYPIRYRAGDRLKVWTWTEEHGLRVLETSAAGTGKTHTAGQFLAQTPEGRQRIFASTNHRNPETPTLESFPDMPSKHSGLVQDPVSGRWRHPRPGEKAQTEASCVRADEFEATYEAETPVAAGKESPICLSCPRAQIEWEESFNPETGQYENVARALTCPYLDAVADVAAQPAYRAYPLSVRASEKVRQTILLDEVTTAIAPVGTRTLTVESLAAQRRNAELRSPKPLFDAVIAPVIDAALALIPDGANHAFGIGPATTASRLPSAQDLADRAIAAGYNCLQPLGAAMDPIAAVKEMARWFKLLSRNLSTALATAAKGQRVEAIREMGRSQAIILLLEVITGDRQATVADGVMSIHRRNRPYQRGDAMILMDATAHPRDVERQLGLAPYSLLWIEQEPPKFGNLTINVIEGIESPGMQRRESCGGVTATGRKSVTMADRLAALVTAILDRHEGTVGAIDNLLFLENLPEHPRLEVGQRYVESRGSNRFETCEALIPVGSPADNLTALAVEFGLITGQVFDPGDDDAPAAFWAWVNRRRAALTVQEASRLRAHRRDDPTALYLIAPPKPILRTVLGAFPGATVETLDVMEIAPEAASKGRQTARSAMDALMDMAGQFVQGVRDKMPTLEEIAAIAGVATSTLSEKLKALTGMGFRALARTSVLLSKALNNKTEVPESDEIWGLVDTLQSLAIAIEGGYGGTPAEILGAVHDLRQNYSAAAYDRAIAALPAHEAAILQGSIVQALEIALDASSCIGPSPTNSVPIPAR